MIAIALVGCAPDWPVSLDSDDAMGVAEAFVAHRSFRQAALEASLQDPIRDYGTLRLEHYTSDWNGLPVYNPAGLSETLPGTEAELLELGRQAFLEVPLSASRQWEPEPGAPQRLDPETLVWVDVGGDALPALTCATCHSTIVDGFRVLGLASPDLELNPDWPLGTVDPTPDGIDNPTTPPDLRPIRDQAALHWSGTLDNSLAGLAVRIDTLLITTYGEAERPPRVVPVAIAAWLWSLADTLPALEDDPAGAPVFERVCAGCHALDGVADPVEVAVVGTDPAAADSSTRGTGRYRVPSLRGVGQRGRLLHDGSVPSLEALLDPDRDGGHPFGQDLAATDRAALLAFLQAR